MLRNILASAIILAASATASADLADDLNAPGANSKDVINAALDACTDDSCKAEVLENAAKAGVDANSIMTIALAANIEPLTITNALRAAKVSETNILAAAASNDIDITTLLETPASGPQGGDSNDPEETVLPSADVPDGIS